MNNKLFCTFSSGDQLESTLSCIRSKYQVLFNKIFILYAAEEDLYLTTYNIDLDNISCFPKDTILVHRNKDTKTLFTVNALNLLIRKLNNGKLDIKYRMSWEEYRNSILLTRGEEFKKLGTKLHNIEEV